MEYTLKTQLLKSTNMKKIFIIGIVAFALAACSNYFDEHYLDNGNTPVTDVKTVYYTLTDNDYKLIAKNVTNIEIARTADSIAGDTVNKPAQKALEAIGKDCYFTEAATADNYLLPFVANKYIYLSTGSMAYVTYKQYEANTSARSYTMFNDDYKEIWDGVANYYISPGSEEKFSKWIDNKFNDVANGAYMFITYNYQNIEPLPYVTTIADILYARDAIEHEITAYVGTIVVPASGAFWLVDGPDSVFVKTLMDQEGNKRNVLSNNNIHTGDQITIHATFDPKETDQPTLVNAVYISHVPANAPRRAPEEVIKEVRTKLYQYNLQKAHWEEMSAEYFLPQSVYDALGSDKIEHPETVIDIYLRNKYPYAVKDESYLVAYYSGTKYVLAKYSFDGEHFVAEPNTSEETMSFEIKEDTWKADLSTYLKAAFVGEGPGKFTIQHVELGELNYIWRYQALYGMTASAYVSGTNHRVEDWLVSPNIKLKKSVKPQLTFDHAVRYGNVEDNPKWLTVWVTDNFTGDVTTTEWKQLEWHEELPDGSNWIFRSAGVWDLSEYNGKTIVIAFRYNTNIDGVEVPSAPTWEIQNLLLAEPTPVVEDGENE